MPIARYYDKDKNENDQFFAGVPLDDLDEDFFNSLPEWLRNSIDAVPFYRKTKPIAEMPKRTADKES